MLVLQAFMFVRRQLSQRLPLNDRGVTAVEYGLLVVFIALAVVGGATLLGSKLSSLFSSVANSL